MQTSLLTEKGKNGKLLRGGVRVPALDASYVEKVCVTCAECGRLCDSVTIFLLHPCSRNKLAGVERGAMVRLEVSFE